MRHDRRLVFAAGIIGFWLLTAASIPFEKGLQGSGQAIPMLISDVDLTCSFYLAETLPDLRVAAAARDREKTVFTVNDLFYSGPVPDGFDADATWVILEPGPSLRLPGDEPLRGTIVYRKGLARVVRIEDGRALMRVEKACGPLTAGQFLAPFEAGSVLRGDELEYDLPFRAEETLTGRIVYTDGDLVQVARGNWALIDLGADQGMEPGRQLTVFHPDGDLPPQAVGNAIVIQAGPRASTIKILGSRESVRRGDLVQVK